VGECSPEPHTYVDHSQAPEHFSWSGRMDDHAPSMLTPVLNQHIPQYCGSCWAFATLSALADRIKLARWRKGDKGADILLSVQHMLNCGSTTAGSCYGGSAEGAYEWIMSSGHIAYASANPYLACSADSKEGFCSHVDSSCTPINVARSCSTFNDCGGSCTGLTRYPNASIKEWGIVSSERRIKAEILKRGPVACGVAATDALDNYAGGVLDEDPADGIENREINHVVSIVGWGTSEQQVPYWIARNSWGEHWGEMGFFRVRRGNNSFALESECVFAIPGDFTVSNHPCSEDSANCGNHNLNKVNGCLGGHGMAGQGQGAAKADKRKRSTTTATALDAEATGKPTGLLLPFQAVSGSS